MSNQPIEPHPEYRALADEVALLREELTHWITREAELLEILKPNLLAMYQQKIGAWEVSALQMEIAARRVRRRFELTQAAINLGKTPDWDEIEGTLELEFLTWQHKLSEAAARVAAAGERLKHLLPPETSRELKKLYYALVKKLHPDLNPGHGESQRRLWQRVQDAWVFCDLEELRALAVLAGESGSESASPEALEKLKKDRDTLAARIQVIEQRLDGLEKQPPFSLRENLNNDEWVAARRRELEEKTAGWKARKESLEEALKVLLSPPKNAQQFGSN